MQVLHVIPTLDRRSGGPASALLGMAKAQSEVGLNVRIVAGFVHGEPVGPGSSIEDGIQITRIGPCRPPLLRCASMRNAMREAVCSADVVHLHGVWEEIQHQAARIARGSRVPYLFTPHGMLTRWSLRQSKFKKQLYMAWRGRRNLRMAEALHCTSHAEGEDLRALNLASPILIEPLGVDFGEFEHLPSRGEFRSENALEARPLIVFLGRVHPGKGVEYLIPALAEPGLERAVLAVVGPDSAGQVAQMQELAAARGVSDRVVFTGMRKGRERIKALVDADVFALPSDHENFGLAVVEALAAGARVVVSDQVNIHREISAAGVGTVVERSVPLLAKALRAEMENTGTYETAAAKARAFAKSTYSWKPIALRWAEHYRRFAAMTLDARKR